MEYIKDFIPIFSTILGGILALAGGVVTITLIQKSTSERESKKIRRKKAEDTYKLILKLDHYTHCLSNIVTSGSMKGGAPEDVKLNQYQAYQFEMLIGFYFPSLNALELSLLNK